MAKANENAAKAEAVTNENAAKTAGVTKVKYRLPRGTSKEDPNFFVAVNGTTYLIPRGVEVELPDFVVAEIERSNKARDHFYETVDTLSAKSGK